MLFSNDILKFLKFQNRARDEILLVSLEAHRPRNRIDSFFLRKAIAFLRMPKEWRNLFLLFIYQPSFNYRRTKHSTKINRAKKTLEQGDSKWATIQGYYSMFHSARALIFSKGYRERSHYCLRIAVKELFVFTNELGSEFIELYGRKPTASAVGSSSTRIFSCV